LPSGSYTKLPTSKPSQTATEVALPATSALVCLAQQSKLKEPSLLYAHLARILIFQFQQKINSTGGRN